MPQFWIMWIRISMPDRTVIEYPLSDRWINDFVLAVSHTIDTFCCVWLLEVGDHEEQKKGHARALSKQLYQLCNQATG